MGLELELVVLLVISVVGQSAFAVFEVETPVWRKILKWSIVIGGTVGLYAAVGHWSLAFPLAAGTAGIVFHFVWCHRHEIDPFRATPRRRYYELRGWTWVE